MVAIVATYTRDHHRSGKLTAPSTVALIVTAKVAVREASCKLALWRFFLAKRQRNQSSKRQHAFLCARSPKCEVGSANGSRQRLGGYRPYRKGPAPDLRVKSAVLTVGRLLQVYSDSRTCSASTTTSQKCHSHCLDRQPLTSGLSRSADILEDRRRVAKVPGR
jgi:hypothetical protein